MKVNMTKMTKVNGLPIRWGFLLESTIDLARLTQHKTPGAILAAGRRAACTACMATHSMPTSCRQLSQHERAQLLRSNPPVAHHPTAVHVAADVPCVDVAAATGSLLVKQQRLDEAQAATQAAWQHMEPVPQQAGSQRQHHWLQQSSAAAAVAGAGAAGMSVATGGPSGLAVVAAGSTELQTVCSSSYSSINNSSSSHCSSSWGSRFASGSSSCGSSRHLPETQHACSHLQPMHTWAATEDAQQQHYCSRQFSAEDAEVSAITFAQQQQQQQQPLHMGMQQQRALLAGISNSGRTSAPPVLLTTGGGGWPYKSSCGLLCSASSRRNPTGFDGAVTGQQPDQQHRQQGERVPALPPRVALSAAVKRQLLVERSGSAQLLPHTLSRRSTLLLGVPDLHGSISLDPPSTPMAQLPACWRSHLGSLRGLVAATTVCSPRVIVLPSTAAASGRSSSVPPPTRPSTRSRQRNHGGAQMNGAPGAAQQPPTGATTGGLLHSSEMNAALQPAAQQQAAAAGASSRQQVAAPAAAPGDSAAQLAAGVRSLSVSPSRGARSLPRQASHCQRSLCLSPSTIGRTPADAGSSQRRQRRSSCERPAPVELRGPLDLDAGAPALSSAERRLGDVQQADVAYIVGRWSHRWQTDRAACAAAAGGGHALPVHAEAAWVRPASALHLFGDSQATYRQFGSLSGAGLDKGAHK